MGGSKRPETSATPTPGRSDACRDAKRINKSANIVRPKAAAPRRPVVPFCAKAIEMENQGDHALDEQSTSSARCNSIGKMCDDSKK
uniref:Uncharacterized protein n=1 Tax=Strigamia maritima TaxID=126957 RepID=T1J050_STRMM